MPDGTKAGNPGAVMVKTMPGGLPSGWGAELDAGDAQGLALWYLQAVTTALTLLCEPDPSANLAPNLGQLEADPCPDSAPGPSSAVSQPGASPK